MRIIVPIHHCPLPSATLARAVTVVALAVGLGVVSGAPALARQGDDEPPRASDDPAATTKATSLERAEELDRKANDHFRRKELVEARASAEEAVEIKEKVLGAEDGRIADSLLGLARILHRQGELDGATKAYRRALGIYETAKRVAADRVGSCLNGLAAVHRDRGDLDESVEMLERALVLYQRVHGDEHELSAIVANNLAGAYVAVGRIADARRASDRSINVLAKVVENEQVQKDKTLRRGKQNQFARALEIRARILDLQGEDEVALRTWEAVVQHQTKALGVHVAVAKTCARVAALYRRRGDYDRASVLAQRALEIFGEVLGKEHATVARLLNNAGAIARARGDLEPARELLERSLALMEKGLAPDHADLAPVLANLAWVHEDAGEAADAEPVLARALSITEKGGDLDAVADASRRLGELLLSRSKPAEAEARFEASAAIAARAEDGGPEARAVAHAEALWGLARARVAQDDGAGAVKHAERARDLLVEGVGAGHPLEVRGRVALASTLRRAGELDRARTLLRDAVPAARELLVQTLGGDRFDVFAANGTLDWALDEWLLATAGTDIDAYEDVHRSARLRPRILASDEVVRRRGAARTKRLYFELDASRVRLARRVLEPGGGEAGEARTATIVSEQSIRDGIAEQIVATVPRYAESRARIDLGWEAGRDALVEGEALVHYRHYAGRYTAWVLAAGAAPRRVELGAAVDIDAAVARFRDALLTATSSADPAFREAGLAVAGAVIDPLGEDVGGARVLYLVLDGALGAIPFGALPAGEDGDRVLGDERTLARLGSAHELVPWSSAVPGAEGALLLGAPDLERSEHAVPPDEPQIGKLLVKNQREIVPLGGMRAPVDREAPIVAVDDELAAVRAVLARHLGKELVVALTGPYATEAMTRRLPTRRRVVHIAAPGVVRRELPIAPAVTGRSAGEQPIVAAGERDRRGFDPFVASGIVLAGARTGEGGRTDEGMLAAEDVARLDLDTAELVVLSAADVGDATAASGRRHGELLGAFQAAGARAIVASLWVADEKDRIALLESLHDAVLTNEVAGGGDNAGEPDDPKYVAPRAEKVAAALREAIASRRDAAPKAWAGFVLRGALR